MSDRNTRDHPDRFEVNPTAQSHFAWLRTRLAVERTLMAWVRTATALIGFGFTIVQFFDSVEYLSYVPPARFPQAPRYLGLALILCGIMALVVSIWEYRWTVGYLWGLDFEKLLELGRRERKRRCTWSQSLSPASACSLSSPCCCVSCDCRGKGHANDDDYLELQIQT